MALSEANRIVDGRASECLSLRAKRSNPLKVQACIRRLPRRSAPCNDMSPSVSPPWVPEGIQPIIKKLASSRSFGKPIPIQTAGLGDAVSLR
jgi:hypothetical protein